MRRYVRIAFSALVFCGLWLWSCGKKTVGEGATPLPGNNHLSPLGKVLYNGIILPDVWPPVRSYMSDFENGMQPPYLHNKPDTINISVGRQLFVDDFLIAQTSLVRSYHYADYHRASPVVKPDKEWETLGNRGSKFAAPFSDGVWYDEVDNKFKMWYMAGGGIYSVKGAGVMCYAESADGIQWIKPNQLVVANSNIVDYKTERDASVVWLDKQESNRSLRYKMFLVARDDEGKWRYIYKTSGNGKLWREVVSSQPIADRSTVYKNPFRNNWVFSIRHNVRVDPYKLVRARDYNEHTDPVEGTRRAEALLRSFWFGPWPDEQRHPDYPSIDPAIYNLDAVPYESLMLGYFSVWQGPENDVAAASGKPKRNQIMLGYSRDGFHWYRQDMAPFMGVGKNSTDWNAGNLQSVAGTPIIAGDELYFYLSGRYINSSGAEITATGLATLRRDGFASMDATGPEKTLLTELFRFDGYHFFVNAKVTGSLKVELLDKNGNVLKGFSQDDCIPYSGDNTKAPIRWKGQNDVSALKDKAIKAKFYVTEGSLYSFWISPDDTGESHGYTAGGGPGLHPMGLDIKK